MKKEQKILFEAQSMRLSLRHGEHVVFRIGKRFFKPVVVTDDGLKNLVASHPRSYIGAYHAK